MMSFWLCLVLLIVTAGLSGRLAENSADVDLSSASSARGGFNALLAKTSSITNVTGTFEQSVERSKYPADKLPYYRSIPAGITRIEQLGSLRSGDGDASPAVMYAFLIDEIARLVYVQSHGQLATLDADSSEHWLSTVDLLSGKPSLLATTKIEVIGVYDIGSDVVDGSKTEVFMLETKPVRDQKFWVDSERGLVLRARWQNTVYELVSVKTNTRLNGGLFTWDLTGKEIPEISQMRLSRWWPLTMLAGANELLTNAETKPLTMFTTSRRGNLEALKGLLSNENVNSKDERGLTPLWIAAAYGKLDVAELLISKGANVNAKAESTGLTPLHIAALNGQNNVVKLLLAKGAEVNALTTASETPLQLAIRRGHGDIGEYLRQHGGE